MVIVTANGSRDRALGIVNALPITVQGMIVRAPVQVLESRDEILL